MIEEVLKGKRKITNAQAVKMLAKDGIQATEKDAEFILDFLYFLAKLTVNQYLKKVDNS